MATHTLAAVRSPTITTPRLELRYPTDDDLFALAALLSGGHPRPCLHAVQRTVGHARSHRIWNATRCASGGRRRAVAACRRTGSLPVRGVRRRVRSSACRTSTGSSSRPPCTVATGSWLVRRGAGPRRRQGDACRGAPLRVRRTRSGRGLHRARSRTTRHPRLSRTRSATSRTAPRSTPTRARHVARARVRVDPGTMAGATPSRHSDRRPRTLPPAPRNLGLTVERTFG